MFGGGVAAPRLGLGVGAQDQGVRRLVVAYQGVGVRRDDAESQATEEALPVEKKSLFFISTSHNKAVVS